MGSFIMPISLVNFSNLFNALHELTWTVKISKCMFICSTSNIFIVKTALAQSNSYNNYKFLYFTKGIDLKNIMKRTIVQD